MSVNVTVNVGERRRGDGVKKRRRGVKGGQRSRLRGGRAGEEEGRNKKRGREDVGEDRFVWEPV